MQEIRDAVSGEQQRILIARALMPRPKLLILDEPCVSLDLAARERFLLTVSKLCREKITLIYVTHHIEEIVPEITHVMILRKGRVYAQGGKGETLTAEKLGKSLGIKVKIEVKDRRYWSTIG